MAGTMAGWTVSTLMSPIELLKGPSMSLFAAGSSSSPPPPTIAAKLQMQTAAGPKLYSGPIDCAMQIVRAQGVLGLWQGFGGTLLFRSWIGVLCVRFSLHGLTSLTASLPPVMAHTRWSSEAASPSQSSRDGDPATARPSFSPAGSARPCSGASPFPLTRSRSEHAPVPPASWETDRTLPADSWRTRSRTHGTQPGGAPLSSFGRRGRSK